ncbi:MAG TPA: hypothetical protein VK920_10655 [Solirubrobacterales bacterium]|nr:hypothetical protein [Solirubrobacterales bacterium]
MSAVAAVALAPGAGAQPVRDPSRITLAFVPAGTDPQDLAAVEGMAIGLMSAGLGSTVPPDQTYLDIGQGNRVFTSLYDEPLPRLFAIGGRVPPVLWRAVLERADSVPADIVPGLLATTIARGRDHVRAGPRAGAAGLTAVDRDGRVPDGTWCPPPRCAGMRVMAVDLERLGDRGLRPRGDGLLIAIERPPPEEKGEQLAIGIAGRGFDGQVTSDSTRREGLVLSTDLAPTILERLGMDVPGAMSGSAIRAEGTPDPDELTSLERRMTDVGPRRGPVIGLSLLVWAAVALAAVAAFGAPGARALLPVVALAGMYVPAALLLAAALDPSETVEQLLVGLGSPVLAVATLAFVRGYGAVAVACSVTVLAYAVDVIAGSPLTALSLIGPNPALGVRFYGIGNELEATIAALVPIGVGAALAGWGSRAGEAVLPRPAALAFGVAALAGVLVFAPGRFGADVGAAIVLPVGAAVAAWFVLGGGRRRLLLAVAAPLLAVAALFAVDLALGGDAHLSRSVLEAGGLDDVGDVVERRLRLSADSFGRNIGKPSMLVCIALIVTGVLMRRRIASWFEGARPALAGLVGAIAATVVGTLANDSGALLLMIGTGFSSLFVAYVWATANPLEPDAGASEQDDR